MNNISKESFSEGYVFASYGKDKYLKDTIVCALTIRRFDKKHPIALYSSKESIQSLKKWGLQDFFDIVEELPEENQSIVGFKHNVHLFMPFDRNIYLDSDMVICRNLDALWNSFSNYPYTITGQESADVYFGSKKSVGIIVDILFRRRQRTLRKFGLTHLFRVQTGIIYAADKEIAARVGELAASYLSRKSETHFVSRTKEKGRKHESCEWSLAMAMSKLKMYVHPWFNGYESPQQDYINGMVNHNEDYTEVEVKYYCNPFMQSLRGIASTKIRNAALSIFKFLPRSQDHYWVTPYILHFGWGHQKKYFNEFSEREWEKFFYKQELETQNNKTSAPKKIMESNTEGVKP